MNLKQLETRIDTLQNISGLKVTAQGWSGLWHPGPVAYCFGFPGRILKTVYTYRKAKVFAEGIAIGRAL
jgi:hypothetical protein